MADIRVREPIIGREFYNRTGGPWTSQSFIQRPELTGPTPRQIGGVEDRHAALRASFPGDLARDVPSCVLAVIVDDDNGEGARIVLLHQGHHHFTDCFSLIP